MNEAVFYREISCVFLDQEGAVHTHWAGDAFMNGYLINFSSFRETRVWNANKMYILRATNAMFKPSAGLDFFFD